MQAGGESINVTPLPVLLSTDVTTDKGLDELREGLMAHVAKGTIDIQQAKGIHELALARHQSSHRDDQTKGFSDLASSIAKELGG